MVILPRVSLVVSYVFLLIFLCCNTFLVLRIFSCKFPIFPKTHTGSRILLGQAAGRPGPSLRLRRRLRLRLRGAPGGIPGVVHGAGIRQGHDSAGGEREAGRGHLRQVQGAAVRGLRRAAGP